MTPFVCQLPTYSRLSWAIIALVLLLPLPHFAQNSPEDSLIKNLADLEQQGRYQQALKVGHSLLQYQQKKYGSDHIKVAQTYNLLGITSELMGQLYKSRNYKSQALEIQEKLYGPYAPQNTYLHINLANIYRKLKEYPQAISHNKIALKLRPKGNYYLYLNLGLSYYKITQYDSALYCYQKALKLANRPGVLTNMGDTYLKLGKIDQAIAHYQQAQREALPFYTRISIQYRLARGWYAKAVRAGGQRVTRYAQRAYGYVQRTDSLIQSARFRAEKNQLVLSKWVQALTELGLSISHTLYRRALTPAQRHHWLEQLFAFSEQQKAPILVKDITGQPRPAYIRLAALQQKLADSVAVLVYGFGQDSLYALAITQTQCVLKALPKDSVAKHEKGYNFYLSTLRVKETVRYTHQMYRWLVAPLYGIIGSKKRWLVVGGILNMVPFDTFCQTLGTDVSKVAFLDINYQRFEYLIWKHTISYATSATLAFWPSPPRAYAQQFFGIAPGVYQDTASRALPYATREVNQIAALIPQPARLLLGKAAHRGQLTTQSLRARWLHFATHAVYDWKENRNGLLLYDGPWLLKDMKGLKLESDLAVLSICNAAAGVQVQGEGRIAITRSFMRAGARNLVFTLWPVNDRLAARLMTSFYKYLVQGQDYAEALRQAKLEFLRDAKPVYGYPGLWAVFMLEGRL